MVINGKPLNGFCAGIDKPEAVLFPSGKFEFGDSGIRRTLRGQQNRMNSRATGRLTASTVRHK